MIYKLLTPLLSKNLRTKAAQLSIGLLFAFSASVQATTSTLVGTTKGSLSVDQGVAQFTLPIKVRCYFCGFKCFFLCRCPMTLRKWAHIPVFGDVSGCRLSVGCASFCAKYTKKCGLGRRFCTNSPTFWGLTNPAGYRLSVARTQ